MSGLLAGYAILGTAIFVLGSLVVAARLLWMWRRTGGAPEGLLGAAILGTAVLGYGSFIVAQVVRQPGAGIAGAAFALVVAGWICHDLGVCANLWFQRRVFRPDASWARAFALGMIVALWLGFAGFAAAGGLREVIHRSPGWWLHQSVIWTYPLWGAFEAFRYWRSMRRRQALGLAEPMVTNRFLLWSAALGTSFLATLCASPGFFVHMDSELGRVLMPISRVATATVGVVSISLYWLVFFPPRWYAARVTARAGALPAA